MLERGTNGSESGLPPLFGTMTMQGGGFPSASHNSRKNPPPTPEELRRIRCGIPLPPSSRLHPAATTGTGAITRASGSFHKLRALADAGQITEDERRNMASGAQLNPDWVEWMMGWPVGWTDIERGLCDWRDLSVEPEDIHIATTRRDNRPARIKAIGNGQVPLCAAVAAESGFAFLASIFRANPGAK